MGKRGKPKNTNGVSSCVTVALDCDWKRMQPKWDESERWKLFLQAPEVGAGGIGWGKREVFRKLGRRRPCDPRFHFS